MCNEIALLVHTRPGDEVICDRSCHIVNFEAGGPAALSGVMIHALDGVNGIFDPDQAQSALRPKSRYMPESRLLCVEQTANLGGGAVWPADKLRAVAAVAKERGLSTHMDGARLMNAVVKSGISAREWARDYDSCWIDFSKGLGAPMGAVLAGSNGFIERAWRIKQQIGGAMRQSGVVSAMCLYALRYWWVNQNQTYAQEISGGYLWSPKRKANGERNAFYESMREVAPGDVVFSFRDTRVAALGIARSYCYESPKPTEFGSIGGNWGAIGWKVEVAFRELANQVRPKDHTGELRTLLPAKYSPLRPTGDGLQSVADAGRVIERLDRLSLPPEPTLEEWERRIESNIQADQRLNETERRALILARRGQGLYRSNVQIIERACRVTKVERREHLIASHIKPWRDSSNDERLSSENGLLLTPTIDHLFDKGFISFESDGGMIVPPSLTEHPFIGWAFRSTGASR
jgi:putative restriction endonuclease